MRISKRYIKASSLVEHNTTYSIRDAVEILCKMPIAKFDETIEISCNLGVDPKKSDQVVRGTVRLPNGSGKSVRVIVFTSEEEVALSAGAEQAGMDELIAKVQGGWLDFDVAIATVSAMKEVRKLARILGPRGLMPNPKSGTVTDDVEEGIRAVKAGRVEYKMDKTANISIVIGKRSFAPEKIEENLRFAVESLISSRPSSFSGQFLKNISISSTMSPGVKINFVKEFKI